MHPELLARALAGMAEGVVTRERFQEASGIASGQVASAVMDFMASKGIGHAAGGTLSFTWKDRLQMALVALQAGCDAEQVCQRLSWKDFEKLASEALLEQNYRTRTNVRFTRPRMEIDVLGLDGSFAIAFDCKHWKRAGPSALARFCEKQVARAEELLRRERNIEMVVPALLTLHAGHVGCMAGGVPVVPVAALRSFVTDLRGFPQKVRVVTREGLSEP